MPLTPIIRDYHSKPNKMDAELSEAQHLFDAMCKKTLYKGKTVSINDFLYKCFTGNHFCHLHLTKAQRPILIKDAVNALKACKILTFSGTKFEDLYKEVENAIGKLNQVGPLIIYDTAKMIGHVLNPKIEPTDYVYTQCGAKEGAKILLGKKRMGRKIQTKDFIKFFPGESSIYIEDMLCIYKAFFKKKGIKKRIILSGTSSKTKSGKKCPSKLLNSYCSTSVNPRRC